MSALTALCIAGLVVAVILALVVVKVMIFRRRWERERESSSGWRARP